MSAEWARRQIRADRLPAVVFRTGGRATYRIRERDFRAFLQRWSISTAAADWEDFAAGTLGR